MTNPTQHDQIVFLALHQQFEGTLSLAKIAWLAEADMCEVYEDEYAFADDAWEQLSEYVIGDLRRRLLKPYSKDRGAAELFGTVWELIEEFAKDSWKDHERRTRILIALERDDKSWCVATPFYDLPQVWDYLARNYKEPKGE